MPYLIPFITTFLVCLVIFYRLSNVDLALIISIPIALLASMTFGQFNREVYNQEYIQKIRYTYENEQINIYNPNDGNDTFFMLSQENIQKYYTVYMDNGNGGLFEKTYKGDRVNIYPVEEGERPYIIIENKIAHKPKNYKYYKYLTDDYRKIDFSKYNEVTILEIHIPKEL